MVADVVALKDLRFACVLAGARLSHGDGHKHSDDAVEVLAALLVAVLQITVVPLRVAAETEAVAVLMFLGSLDLLNRGAASAGPAALRSWRVKRDAKEVCVRGDLRQNRVVVAPAHGAKRLERLGRERLATSLVDAAEEEAR